MIFFIIKWEGVGWGQDFKILFMSGLGLGYPPHLGFGTGTGNHKKSWDGNRTGVTHPEPTPLPSLDM